ncbi:MAG: N-6 DNA methylase [Spirochaetales bacterium]|nr:N-6 DNA methylase [Spirochaetales bacterium]
MRKNAINTFSFDTMTLEGSLFVADLLEKAALGTASHQESSDYAVPRGLRLSDEYGRAYQIARASWLSFAERGDSNSFLMELFRDVLGWHGLRKTNGKTIGERLWPITVELAPGIPLVTATAAQALDKADEAFALSNEGRHKKSPFQLAQEYLNADPDAEWALVSNGLVVRLLRDSQSLVRPAYLEFNLETILREERFPDFCAFWRILHASRAVVWPLWRAEGLESGTRVRDGLRDGVTRALIALGSGFLSGESAANAALREVLNDGSLSRDEFYRELLRLVYRFLFLFTIEERNLLHSPDAPNLSTTASSALRTARERYEAGYSMARLRDRALRANASGRYGDLWEGVQVVFRALRAGEAALDLPALGGLFADTQCPHLEPCSLSNASLLELVRRLRWATIGGSRSLIDYKNMDTEEFGSVYESLLELVPVVDLSSRTFSFVGIDAEAGSTAGNARKTTGSYYTPDCLVKSLVNSTLDPVIQQSIKNGNQDVEKLILTLTVIDPACGSGHFLLAAARRIAEVLAEIRSNSGKEQVDYKACLREVIGRCIYGVDINPLAIELARTALWLEGYESGKPLGFIDHHIRCGNSLIGLTDLSLIRRGIPISAFKQLQGDDAKTIQKLSNRNEIAKQELNDSQGFLFEDPIEKAEVGLTDLHCKLQALDESSLSAIELKNKAFQQLLNSIEYRSISNACNTYLSTFFLDKSANEVVPITSDVIKSANGIPLSPALQNRIDVVSSAVGFFNWQLEFPEVFSNGGFHCILGNPPWDIIQEKENDTVSSYHVRMKRWFSLGIYEVLSGRRDLYKLFLSIIPTLLRKNGHAGFVLPVGFMFEDDSEGLRTYLNKVGSVDSIIHIQNTKKAFFNDVHASYRFVLYVFEKEISSSSKLSYIIHLPQGLDNVQYISFTNRDSHFITGAKFSTALFENAEIFNTYETVYTLLSKKRKLNYQVLAEFHVSTDKKLLSVTKNNDTDWALAKNATLHFFHPYYGPVEKYVTEAAVFERLEKKGLSRKWIELPRILFRDIARNDDTRSLITCLMPPGFVSTYDTPMVVPIEESQHDYQHLAFYAAYLSTFLTDFLIRPFIDKHVKGYVLERIPIIDFEDFSLTNKVLETADSIIKESWEGKKSNYNKDNDIALLNALFFFGFGIEEDLIVKIMNSFSLVKKEDEKQYGSYRTLELILSEYKKLEKEINV